MASRGSWSSREGGVWAGRRRDSSRAFNRSSLRRAGSLLSMAAISGNPGSAGGTPVARPHAKPKGDSYGEMDTWLSDPRGFGDGHGWLPCGRRDRHDDGPGSTGRRVVISGAPDVLITHFRSHVRLSRIVRFQPASAADPVVEVGTAAPSDMAACQLGGAPIAHVGAQETL